MTPFQIVAVLLSGCLGTLFLVAGGLVLTALLLGRAARRHAVTAAGVVTGYEETQSDDTPRYHPIVTFRDAKGAEHTAKVDAGTDKPFAVGQAVTVEYDPDVPSSVWIAGHHPDWGMWVFAVVGLMAGGGGVLIAILVWAKVLSVGGNTP
jgi:hypothetical protein